MSDLKEEEIKVFTDAVAKAVSASRSPAQLDRLVERIVKKKASAYRASLLSALKK